MGTHPIFESDFDCLTEWPSGAKVIHDGLSKSDKTAITLIIGIGKKSMQINGPKKDYLFFGDIDIADGPFQMKIKKMASCTGESMASNRKNKLICYWDYELELNGNVSRKSMRM